MSCPWAAEQNAALLFLGGVTIDLSIAEEAAVTADVLSNAVEQLCDVGPRVAIPAVATRSPPARSHLDCLRWHGRVLSAVAGLVAARLRAVRSH